MSSPQRRSPSPQDTKLTPAPVSAPAPITAAASVAGQNSKQPSAPAQIPIGAAAAGPQNNVYRVLMDFKPSMDDELELRTGQLVRLVHEYDDGWVSTYIKPVSAQPTDVPLGSLCSP